MSALTSLVSLHLAGEVQDAQPDDLTLDTVPGKSTLTRTDAALTAYGGLVAWSGFLKHLGIVERFAEHCPVTRRSPNATPGREALHSFALSALVEGKRFCNVRWLIDDPAIANLMNLDRVRGEDALPRLAKEMSVEAMRAWLQQPQTELYAALPERFIADWDSTLNKRYGHQEDAAVGYPKFHGCAAVSIFFRAPRDVTRSTASLPVPKSRRGRPARFPSAPPRCYTAAHTMFLRCNTRKQDGQVHRD
jgi:hypothetical protein